MPIDPDLISALRGPQGPDVTGPAFSMPPDQLHQMSGNGGRELRKVHIIRHGATSLNSTDASMDRIRGWKDVPLSPEGRKEAEKLGDKLAKAPPSVLVSSDLKRAHDTAQIISDKTGAPYDGSTHMFRPWNVGDYAGQLSSKVLPILGKYAAEKPEEQVPGGESFNDFRQRFLNGLLAVLIKHDGDVGVVAHHRNERLLNAWAKAGFKPDGTIDEKEFNSKGESTGGAQSMVIPMDKLRDAAGDGGSAPPLSAGERHEEIEKAKDRAGREPHHGRIEGAL